MTYGDRSAMNSLEWWNTALKVAGWTFSFLAAISTGLVLWTSRKIDARRAVTEAERSSKIERTEQELTRARVLVDRLQAEADLDRAVLDRTFVDARTANERAAAIERERERERENERLRVEAAAENARRMAPILARRAEISRTDNHEFIMQDRSLGPIETRELTERLRSSVKGAVAITSIKDDELFSNFGEPMGWATHLRAILEAAGWTVSQLSEVPPGIPFGGVAIEVVDPDDAPPHALSLRTALEKQRIGAPLRRIQTQGVAANTVVLAVGSFAMRGRQQAAEIPATSK
jgi:hypothetical protein